MRYCARRVASIRKKESGIRVGDQSQFYISISALDPREGVHVAGSPDMLDITGHADAPAAVADYVRSLLRIPFRWMGLQYLSRDSRKYFTSTVR